MLKYCDIRTDLCVWKHVRASYLLVMASWVPFEEVSIFFLWPSADLPPQPSVRLSNPKTPLASIWVKNQGLKLFLVSLLPLSLQVWRKYK